MIILFTLVAFAYLSFLLWLRNGITGTPQQQTSKKRNRLPLVSVIVAARNEEDNIGNLLQHVLCQDYPGSQLEVVIANDDSADSTGDIVRKFSENDSRVTHLLVDDTPDNWSPKMWALSKAVQSSEGEILVFTDADCTMGASWISTMAMLFKDTRVGMVGGPSPLENGGGLWRRALLLDSLGQDSLAAGGFARGFPLTVSGRNLAIRRSAFDSVRGYEEINSFFSGDDTLIMHKIIDAGWEIEFCVNPEAQVKSPPPPDFASFVRQRLRFASKGKIYYELPFVRSVFRWIVSAIFLANLAVVAGMAAFVVSLDSTWLLPWFVKMIGDGILIAKYTSLLSRPFEPAAFLLDEIWHSLYVVVFGILGPLLPISWKGRRKSLRIG
ncbi:MAG: glycosyltransferase [Candidatus Neomarinimicrobiota bacterium]